MQLPSLLHPLSFQRELRNYSMELPSFTRILQDAAIYQANQSDLFLILHLQSILRFPIALQVSLSPRNHPWYSFSSFLYGFLSLACPFSESVKLEDGPNLSFSVCFNGCQTMHVTFQCNVFKSYLFFNCGVQVINLIVNLSSLLCLLLLVKFISLCFFHQLLLHLALSAVPSAPETLGKKIWTEFF